MKYFNICVASSVLLLLASTSVQSQNAIRTAEASTANYDAGHWSYDGTRERLMFAVQKLLGNKHGNYISMPPAPGVNAELTLSQFNFAFAGTPEPIKNLQAGRKLFIGSAPHDAGEKAFVVTEGDSLTVVGVALFHQSCFAAKCPARPILTFFVPQRDKLNPQVREDVVGWLMKYTQARNETFKDSSPDVREAMLIGAFDVVVQNLPDSL